MSIVETFLRNSENIACLGWDLLHKISTANKINLLFLHLWILFYDFSYKCHMYLWSSNASLLSTPVKFGWTHSGWCLMPQQVLTKKTQGWGTNWFVEHWSWYLLFVADRTSSLTGAWRNFEMHTHMSQSRTGINFWYLYFMVKLIRPQWMKT